MKLELKRSMTLSLQQLEKPYYVSYTIETGHQWGATAVMGGLLGGSSAPFRYPAMQLRVGTTNSIRQTSRAVDAAHRIPSAVSRWMTMRP